MFRRSKHWVWLLLCWFVLAGQIWAMPCDVDGDGDVDLDDLNLIQQAILARAKVSGPNDPRDADGNGVINSIDGRLCALRCTRAKCSTVNQAPFANAGPDQTVKVGSTVLLSGAASSDPDGDPLRFAWILSSRPLASVASLIDAATVAPRFIVDKPGQYLVQLVVSDGKLNSAPDAVIISTENSRPIANAGPAQSVRVGTLVTLNGARSTDVDGDPLQYTWQLATVPPGSGAILNNPGSVNPTLLIDLPGRYLIALVVSDGKLSSLPDTVTVTTENSPPVANPGANQSIPLGAVITLDGSRSSDVDGDPLIFRWSLLARPPGSAAVLSNPSTVRPSFVADFPGAYVVQLIVNDGTVDSAPASVTLTTANAAPIANAGPDQSVPLGSGVTLDGSASRDPEAAPLAYTWSLTGRPAGSNASLIGGNTVHPSFTADRPGNYVAQLIVSDGQLTSQPDTVTISTLNSRPVADAGAPQSVAAANPVQLDGSASRDADGDPLTFAWSLTTLPPGSGASITGANLVNPTFLPDLPGTYIAQLIVSDGQLSSLPATVIVTVTAANRRPIAVAEAIPTKTTVGSPVLLKGTGSSDPDGDPLTWFWSIALRPGGSNAAIVSPTAAQTSFVPDLPGIYTIQLVVRDGKVDSVPALVVVEVLPVNHPPVITSAPVTNATSGKSYGYSVVASDPDVGDVLTWSLVTAPSGMTIDRINGVIAWTPGLGQLGSYPVSVRVADQGGLSATQEFTLAVGTANQPPVISFAGIAPQWMQLAPTGTAPVPRYAGSLHTYDEVNDRLIVFGGQDASTVQLNEVWVLSQASGLTGTPAWTKLEPTGSAPSPRPHFVSAYDATANRLIVYGGCNGFCSPLSDAWVLTHANGLGGQPEWLPLPASNALAYGVGGYDPISNRLVVFGGSTAGKGSDTTDVKVLLDANGIGDPRWLALAPEGPRPPVRGHSQPGVYDALSNTLIVFGGQSTAGGSSIYNDVWVLSNANGLGGVPTWTQLSPAGLPPIPRAHHTMAYDPNSNRLIVFGGYDSVQDRRLNDTWALTYANGQGGTPEWIPLTSGATPAVASSATAGYRKSSNRLIVALGVSTAEAVLSDVWVLANASGNCTAGQPCTLKVTASDPDVGDTLRYSLDAAPPGMAIDSASGAIVWTPAIAQIGSHAVTVRVTDRGGLFATQTFTATVAPVAVPNVVGLAPEWAESFITTADLAVGTKTSQGGAVTLNFDSLPSRQGWVYDGDGPEIEQNVFSLRGGVLVQDSLDVGAADPLYYFPNAVDVRFPFSLQMRGRVLRNSGLPNHFGFHMHGFLVRGHFGVGIDTEYIRTEMNATATYALVSPVPYSDAGFHDFRAMVVPEQGYRFFVDNNLLRADTVSDLRSVASERNGPGIAKRISFGDGTRGQNALAEIAAYSFTQPRVVGQNPPAGTLVPNKTAVDLTIVDGPATETVPNVIGLTQPAATSAILTANLKVGGVTSASHPTIPAGQVSDQSPLPNIHVPKDTPVNIVLSTGPPQPVNRAPAITSMPVPTGAAGQPYVYQVTAADPDAGDVLVFSLLTAPAGMTIDPASGLVSWTPTEAQVGSQSVSVRVTDKGGLSATQVFSIIVAPPNHPPVITSKPNTAQWIQMNPTGNSPTRRARSGSGYDAVNDRLIVFGGEQVDGNKLNDVWVLVNASGASGAPAWVQLAATGGPPLPRHLGVAAYDPTANRLLIYGGCTGNCGTILGDAWVLTNANGLGGVPEWRQLPSAAPRSVAGAAYDPIWNRLMVFGGLTGGPSSEVNSVRVLVDANGVGDPHWIDLTPNGPLPPARGELQNVIYDSTGNRLIVFGGHRTAGYTEYNDTWVLTNANGLGGASEWQQIIAEGTPPSRRDNLPISWDPNSNRLIIFGGLNQASERVTYDDSWVLTSANGLGGTSEWIKLQPTGPLPMGRRGYVSAYDSRSNRLIAAFGENDLLQVDPVISTILNDVWVLTNASGNCTANQSCNYKVDASDPDAGDVLTYRLDAAPTGMAIDSASGAIVWTPAIAQIGSHAVTVRVTDRGGLFATQTFTATVAPVAVPNVVGLAPEWAESFITAADLAVGTKTSKGGAVTLNFDSLPSRQGWVFWGNADISSESSLFQVSGGSMHQNTLGTGSSVIGYAMLKGVDPRLPLSIAVRARVTAEEGGTSENHGGFAFFAWSPDNNLFGVGLGTGVIEMNQKRPQAFYPFDNTVFHNYLLYAQPGVGSGLTVDGTRFPTGLPQVYPTTPYYALYLGDATGGPNARATITAYSFTQPRVVGQNPPAGTLVPNKTAVDLTIVDGPATETVPNVIGLTQPAATTAILAANLKMGGVTSAPHPTIPAGQVSDQSPLPNIHVPKDTPVAIVMSTGPPDHAPAINSAPVLTATAGQPYAYPVTATDPDAGDTLTFSLPTAPAGMSINAGSGLIAWTPTLAQVGSQNVTVRVTDAAGLFAEQSFAISVASLPSANRPPVITSTAVTTALTGKPYVYDVEAIDPDADPVSFKLLVAQDCLPPPPDMVGWWSGDGTTRDLVNGNNGEARLGATYGPGMVGKAFSFDGIDDYVYVPYSPVFHFGEKQDFTIDAWINLKNPIPGRDGEIVITGDYQQLRVDPSKTFYRFFVSRDTRTLHLRMGNTNFNYFLVSNQSIPLNRWTHVAAVRKGATSSLYINGELETSAVMTDGPLTNGGPLSIGGIYDTAQTDSVQKYNVFGGLIDELEIHRRALSAGEIRAVYQAGSLGKCKEPRGLPEGMTFDPVTGLIQWTPSLLQAGRYYVSVEANDGRGGKDVQSFVIDVSPPPNRPPVITSEPVRDARIGVPYQYGVVATDPDGDALTYKLTSGEFKGLQGIATGASGEIYVVDDRAFSGLGGVFRVDPVSGGQTVVASAGELVGPRGIAVDAGGKLFVVDPFAVAGAGAVIRIDPATGSQTIVSSGGHFVLPSGIAIAGDGTLYVADADALGGPGAVIRVHPTTGEQTLVAFGGDFVHPVGVAIDAAGRLFVLDRHAFSSGPNDIGGGVIAVDPATGAQTRITSGGNFSGRTGTSVVSVAPDKLAVSAFSLRSGSVVFSVNPDTKVQALIAQAGNLVLPTGLALEPGGNIVVADFMAFGTGGVLRISPTTGNQTIVSPAIVEGMTIDARSGLIRWTPVAGQVGDHPVTVRVEDGNGGVAMQVYSVRVASGGPVNAPPVVTSTALTAATAGQPYAYPVTATDPNPGDVLTFSLPTAPAGMTINATTGQIAWTPTLAQVGNQNVTVRVTDQGGLFAEQAFTITVSAPGPGNQPPSITSTPVTAATAGATYTYQVSATDPNPGDVLTYSLTTAPAGMTINAMTGLIQWAPTATDAGDHPVEVKVRDAGGLFATQAFTLTVTAVPACVPPPAGLISWWPGEGNTLDRAAANDGLAENGPTFAAGLVGQAFRFDGVDALIRIANSRTIGFSGPFSVEFWFNPTTTIGTSTPNQVLLAKGRYSESGFNAPVAIQVLGGDGRLLVRMPPAPALVSTTAAWPAGTWHHIALSWDGARYRLYVNGIEEAGLDNAFSIIDSIDPITLGNADGFAAAGFAGLLDEATLYNRALTPAEVSALHAARALGKCTATYSRADAGPDQAVEVGATVTLDGSASRAFDGAPLVYQWTLVSRPADSAAVLNNPSSVNPSFVADKAGSYALDLIVSNAGRNSAPARVTITATKVNHAPIITSTPIVAATAGRAYSYPVTARDPDPGDTLSFSLPVAPAGMGINAASGLIQWIPAQTGNYNVSVRVQDQGGLFAMQSFVLAVAAAPVPVTVPNVVGQEQTTAQSAITAASLTVGTVTLAASETVAAGRVISQNPTAGTVVNSGSAVSLVVSSGPPGPAVSSIRVTPINALILTGQTQAFAATGILSNGSSLPLTGGLTWASSNPAVATIDAAGVATALAEGSTTISATKDGVTGSAVLGVAQSVADGTLPIAQITAPADGASIAAAVPIVGTASDANFLKYVLEIAPFETGVFSTLAVGTAPVTQGTLATLDPTTLVNDLYVVRLTVVDKADNRTQTEITVQLTRDKKVGNFTLAFQDVNVPMAGIPISVVRSYDSRDKTRGDFGIGWRLDVQSLRLRVVGVQGQGWQQTQSGGVLNRTYTISPTMVHKVAITLPDGKVEEFDLTVSPSSQRFAPIDVTTATYTPRPLTRGSLRALGETQLVTFGVTGPLDLLTESSLQVFDPQEFEYTTPEGQVILISRTAGVKQIRDRNGNTVSFTPGGITHSAGKSIVFNRDSQNRITSITDPQGNVQSYAYDINGDLASHTDAESRRTGFLYNYDHGLIEIQDPRGVRPIRNDYDDAGRLIRTTDAYGKTITYTHDLGANREVITDRLGNATIHVYDDLGNVTQTADALGGVTNRSYDARGNTLSETDPLGRTRTYTYDGQDNRLTETDPLGRTTIYTYNGNRQVLTVTDALGRTTTNAYDGAGNLTSTTDASGQVTSYTYDTRGLQLTRTDPLGNVTQYAYDASGNLSSETDAVGRITSYSYDINGNRLTQTTTRTTAGGSETLTSSFTYDKANRLTQTTHPDGSVTRVTYNAIGKQSVTTDQLGRETKSDYDDMGRLTRTTYPDGSSETSTYDAEGRRTGSTDRAGRTTTSTYDALGRLVATVAPDGSSTSTTYDAAGQVLTSTDARGNATTYVYDGAGRRTQVIDALGKATTFSYDDLGNQTRVTDANGNAVAFSYDANNRRTRSTYADGTFEQVSYDALGRQTAKTDQAGKTTQFAYDALGRLIRVTDALGQITTYSYDEQGNQLTQTDAEGRTTRFAYDRMGRRSSRTLPLGQTETFSYDAAGNLRTKTDFNGRTTSYAYDSVNRLLRKTPDGSLGQPPVVFTYTPSGQRASMQDASGSTTYSYDSRDRLLSKATPQGTLSYRYDAAGNLTRIQSNHAGGAAMDYSYDARNRLATVTDAEGRVTSYSYDAVGNLAGFLYPNGVQTTYTYNPLNRLTNVTGARGTTTIAGYSYTLGPSGNRTAVTETSGRRVDYTYDDLYRLRSETTSADPAGPNGAIAYTYDKVGNRLARTSSVAGITDQSFEYDFNDRLGGEGYDNNGNTLTSGGRTFGYDFENHLTSADGGVSFVYNGDGIRVAKTAGGVTTGFLVDDRNPTGYAQVLEEIVGGAVERSYTYGLRLVSQKQASGVSFYGYDGHGSVRYLTDASGAVTDTYAYEAFGNLVGQSGATANGYLYAGEQVDGNVGFYYLRARNLSPSTGRFIVSDAYEGTVFDPRTLHKYAYAHANPANHRDPTGQYTLVEAILVGSITSIIAVNVWQRIDPKPTIAKAAIVATGAFLAGVFIGGTVSSILETEAVYLAGIQGGIYTAPVLHSAANPHAAEKVLGEALTIADRGRAAVPVLVNTLNIAVPETLRFRRPDYFAVGRYIADSKFYTLSPLVMTEQLRDFIAIAKYYNTPLYIAVRANTYVDPRVIEAVKSTFGAVVRLFE